MSSATKAWFVLTTIAVSSILASQYLWGRQGLLWALVLSLGANALLYFLGDSRVARFFPGHLVEGRDPWRVQEIVTILAKKSRLPKPRIILHPSHSPQALSIGRTWSNGAIFLTQGLLEKLSYKELYAVIAFQMACIKRQDTFIFGIGSFFAGLALSITAFFDTVFRVVVGAKKEGHSYQSQFFTSVLAPLISIGLRISIPRTSYYDIDAMAATWLEDPLDLAKALWKIESYSKTLPMTIPASTGPLFIITPLSSKGWTKYLISQPKTEQRILKLIGYYPI